MKKIIFPLLAVVVFVACACAGNDAKTNGSHEPNPDDEDETVTVTGLILNKMVLNIAKGGMGEIEATVLPASADDQLVLWSSSDSKVATVDDGGMVTGVKEGATTVTAKTHDGGFEKTCKITVTDPSSIEEPQLRTRDGVLTFLKECADNGDILFGRHRELTWGMGEDKKNWSYRFTSLYEDVTKSDTYRLTGQFPAMIGEDAFEHMDNGRTADYESMKAAIRIFATRMNGLINLSCHIANPWWFVEGKQNSTYRYVSPNHPNVVREILELDGSVQYNSTQTVKQFFDQRLDMGIETIRSLTFLDDGTQIPVLVRLYHEASREFFWWGDTHCTLDEYIALFRYTVDRMRAKCDNLIFVHCPDRNWTSIDSATPPTIYGAKNEPYLKRYPGDDYVDILTFDDYFIAPATETPGFTSITDAITRLKAISNYAEAHNKIVGLAETGLMGGRFEKVDQWFSKCLYEAISASGVRLSYFQIWSSWLETGASSENGIIYPYKKVSKEADDLRNFISKDRIKMNDFMPKE